MNDAQVAVWLTVVMFFEVIAVCVAFFYVFAQDDAHMHVVQKIGFAFMVFGLVVQVVRSMHYLDFGYYPIDRYFPMWITKDIGAIILIYYYSFIARR